MPLLMDKFVASFGTVFGPKEAGVLLNNRIDNYGRLIRNPEHANVESFHFYLSQFMVRSAGKTVPEVYPVITDLPVSIGNFFTKTDLMIEILVSEKHTIPMLLDSFDAVYKSPDWRVG